MEKKRNKVNLQVNAPVTSGRPAAPSASPTSGETRFDLERYLCVFALYHMRYKKCDRGDMDRVA